MTFGQLCCTKIAADGSVIIGSHVLARPRLVKFPFAGRHVEGVHAAWALPLPLDALLLPRPL